MLLPLTWWEADRAVSEREDDIILCKQIKKGISSAGLDLLWTGDQKQKFNEFKDSKFVNSFTHKLSVKYFLPS